jgi:hypothetical protein
MSSTLIIIFILAIGCIGIALAITTSAAATAVRKENLEKILTRFPGARAHTAPDGTYLAVDLAAERVIVGRSTISPGGGMPYDAVYAFPQIASVELAVDGNTISRTNRGSQAVGAAVGAVALGGVGAIIGGLSGSTTTKDTVRRIGLKIISDDPQVPLHDIMFFRAIDQSRGDRMDASHVVEGRRIAEEFHAHLVVAMRAGARPAPEAPDTSRSAATLALQLKELRVLQETGTITPEEYDRRKKIALRNG